LDGTGKPSGGTVTNGVVIKLLVVAVSLTMEVVLWILSRGTVVTDARPRDGVVVGPSVTPVLLSNVAELCSPPAGPVVVRLSITEELTSVNVVLAALPEVAVAVLTTTVLVRSRNVVLAPEWDDDAGVDVTFVTLLPLLEVISPPIVVFTSCWLAVALITEVVPSEIVEVLLAGSSDGASDESILIALLTIIVVVSVIEAVFMYGGAFVGLATAAVLSTTVVNELEVVSVIVVVGTSTEKKVVSVIAVVGKSSEKKVVSGRKEIRCGAPVRQSASVSHNGSNKHLPASVVLDALYPGIARIAAESAEPFRSTGSSRSTGSAAVSDGPMFGLVKRA
jgi:hypothetical protein